MANGTIGSLLQGSASSLQGGSSTQPTPSVGVKAKNPVTNLPKTTTTLPASQAAPATPAPAHPSDTAYSKPEDFISAGGKQDFSNVQSINQGATPTGQFYKYANNPTVYKNSQYAAPAPQTSTAPAPQPTPTGPYTPPNQGTTGVSQGGIIGNLLGIAQKETPEVTQARANLQQVQNDYANVSKNIASSPFGLTEQGGQQGILNQLFAAKQAAAQTALQSALESQSQQIGATQAAGGLNAPITGVPYGTQTISPSQPATGTPFGQATTSGAANISALVGQRPSQTSPGTTEYYNTQTGQGFSNPQQLADFVNQQIPGANANAQNVFSIISSQGTGTGSGGALNPLNNVSSIAQQVISGQISPQQAYAMGGSVANWEGLLNAELNKQSPGFDTSAAQAKYEANQAVQGSQAQQVAAYQSAHQQASNLASQLNDLITTFGLNPSDINAANAGIQAIARNTSDARYKVLLNYLTDIASRYAQVLTPTGGSQTDTVRDTAQGMLDKTASGQSIQQVIQGLDQQAQAVISGVKTPSTTGSPTASSSTLGLF